MAESRLGRLKAARKIATHTALEWELLKAICGPNCVRCGEGGWRLEKDHITPIYQGGSDGIENIQPVCARCNASKGPEAIDHRLKAYPSWAEHMAEVLRLLETRKEGAA